MKKSFLSVVSILFFVGILLNSCSKTTKTAFTNATMKPWFDSECASCHASGASAASDWKYDATDYESSIKGHISHIYDEVYVKKQCHLLAYLTPN